MAAPREDRRVGSVTARHVEDVHEHLELRRLLERLSAAFEANESRDDLAVALGELRDSLDEHFQHEEVNGYFDEILERAPRLAPKVAELKRQHPSLLTAARGIQTWVDQAGGDETAMERAESEYREFILELLSHEGAENDLLQQAYNEDLGTSD